MRNLILAAIALLCFQTAQAQFSSTKKDGLTIIVTDGTDVGKNSTLQPPDSTTNLLDPIRSLGMSDAIQAAAFIDRPSYGLAGFLLVFCVNDSIGGNQGRLFVNGEMYKGIYRLIRQKISLEEQIPDNMLPYKLSGTVFFLGVS
ncbi:MAG: hypothetical protein AB8F74_06405 [Saprospiraceae bacterium]